MIVFVFLDWSKWWWNNNERRVNERRESRCPVRSVFCFSIHVRSDAVSVVYVAAITETRLLFLLYDTSNSNFCKILRSWLLFTMVPYLLLFLVILGSLWSFEEEKSFFVALELGIPKAEWFVSASLCRRQTFTWIVTDTTFSSQCRVSPVSDARIQPPARYDDKVSTWKDTVFFPLACIMSTFSRNSDESVRSVRFV